MAKPNYNYEKRQRDLAKKKKKDEKLAKKQAAKNPSSTESENPATIPVNPDVPSDS